MVRDFERPKRFGHVQHAKRITQRGNTLDRNTENATTNALLQKVVNAGDYLYPGEPNLFNACYSPSLYNNRKFLKRDPYSETQLKRVRELPEYETWRQIVRERTAQVATYKKTRSADTTAEELRERTGGYGRDTRSRTRSVNRTGETVSGRKRAKTGGLYPNKPEGMR